MALTLNGTSGITGAGIGTIGPSGANITGVGTFTKGYFSSNVYITDQLVHTGDEDTQIRFPTTDAVSVETAGSEAARIDSSQRLLVGHTSSHADLHGKIQLAGAASQSIDVARYGANANPSYINLYKSRNASTGGNTVVQDDDTVGYISGSGNDGSGFHSAAGIAFRIDGTPGDNDMPGRIDFETVPDGGTTLTNRLSIESGGDVKIVTGDLYFGTSAKGIVLGATSNTAANTLDDYEEGTFTPALTNGYNSITYNSQYGHYTKIGRFVSYSIYLYVQGAGGDNAEIRINTPFTTANTTGLEEGGSIVYQLNFLSTSDDSKTNAYVFTGKNMSYLRLIKNNNGAAIFGNDTTLGTGGNNVYLIIKGFLTTT